MPTNPINTISRSLEEKSGMHLKMGPEVHVNMMKKLKGRAEYHLLQIEDDKMHQMLLVRGRTMDLRQRYSLAGRIFILPPLILQTADHLRPMRLMIAMCHLYAVRLGMSLMMIQAQLVRFIVHYQVAVIL